MGNGAEQAVAGCFESISSTFTGECLRQTEKWLTRQLFVDLRVSDEHALLELGKQKEIDQTVVGGWQSFRRAFHGGDGFGEAAEFTPGSCP